MAPEFGGHMVATPLGAILDWTMGTPAGFAAFRDPRVNAMIKKILNSWCEFPQQRRLALRAQRFAVRLEMRRGPAHGRHRAVRTRSEGRTRGLCLVERLFTRRFKDGERPVASPGDDKCGRDRRVRPRGHSPAARPQGATDARPLEARRRQHGGLRHGGWPPPDQPEATSDFNAREQNPHLLGYEDGAGTWAAFFRADRRRGH